MVPANVLNEKVSKNDDEYAIQLETKSLLRFVQAIDQTGLLTTLTTTDDGIWFCFASSSELPSSLPQRIRFHKDLR